MSRANSGTDVEGRRIGKKALQVAHTRVPRSSLVQEAFEKGALKSVFQQRPTGKHENDTLRSRRPQEGTKWQGIARQVALGSDMR